MKKEELKRLEGLIKNELMIVMEMDADELEVTIEKIKTGYKLNVLDLTGLEDCDLELYADCQWDIEEGELLYLFIKSLYDTEINWRSKYIKQTTSYLYRKVGSLELWTRRENEGKINKINNEIIERYKQNQNYKYEIADYKSIINALYNIKNELDNKEVA